MMFDKLCLFLIYYRNKTETRRKYNPNRRPAIPNSIHKLKIDRTTKTYGQIKILDVYTQKFKDISQKDAIAEGFESVKKYKDYFEKINGKHNPDDLIWVVKFSLITED